MLGFALDLSAQSSTAWWASDALYAADFVNDRYMREGAPIPGPLAYGVTRNAPKYVADSQGRWRAFPANVPARTDRGLHLDPAVTYAGLNSALAGAVPGLIGGSGARPNGWSPGTSGGLSVEIIGTGDADGIPYIRVRLFGTTDSTDMQWMFDESTVVAAAGQTWTGVLLVRHVAGSLANITPAMRLAEQQDGSYLTASQTEFAVGPDFTLGSITRLLDQPNTNRARMRFRLLFQSVGQAVDVTLDLALPSVAMTSQLIGPALSTLSSAVRPSDTLSLAVDDEAVSAQWTSASGSQALSISGSPLVVATHPIGTLLKSVTA